MPNDFYTRAYSPLPEQRVSSQVLKDEFARVEAGFDEVQGDADRAIKLPVGTADQTLAMDAGARANLVLAFDASGNITAISYGRYRGDWLTATAYVLSDYFRDPTSKNIYAVIVGHTSGVLATDIAANRVQLAINVADVETAKAAAEAAAATATTQAGLATTNGAAQVALATAQAELATTNGAAQVALAATQAGISTTQAGIATAAAGTATTQAGVATTQAGLASTSYINFDKRSLGSKAADPALDNQGAALAVGALYFNTVFNTMRVWNGAAWEAAYLPASGYVTEAPLDGNAYARKNAAWTELGKITRVPRTSNTQLVAADAGKWIDITSGTFSQTFDAVATLGDGWWCYLRNSGTGDITLDPNAAELIDGLTSYVMYPGECRLVQCDGAALRTIVLNAFYKVFTASGFFIKPPGYSWFGGLLWAGGASGANRGSTSERASGGGGGSCLPFNAAAPLFGATETVTIGSGGPPMTVAGSTSATNLGGDSSVGAVLITHAGKLNQAGGSSISGATVTTAQSPYVLGVAGGQSDARSYYGGGGGGGIGAGASSFYGGGGGAGVYTDLVSKNGGASVFGGSGGSSNSSSSGQDGFAPGGGGGGTQTGPQSGAGARGELRIWGLI